jgi:hypothetical protein
LGGIFLAFVTFILYLFDKLWARKEKQKSVGEFTEICKKLDAIQKKLDEIEKNSQNFSGTGIQSNHIFHCKGKHWLIAALNE